MVIMKTKKLKRPLTKAVDDEDPDRDGTVHTEEIPQEIRIIAQEVKIVRALACNDVNKRNRQLRKLRKWLELRTSSSFPFSEEDFMRIWKGLYYNMWMSDKPLVQEDLAEQLGQLLHCFDGNVATSVNFFGAFMQTMCNEWFGIDQWRIDKFMMLVRRMLRYMFRVLRRADWNKEAVQLFSEHMARTVLADDSPAIGLTMHYLDIFFEELAKVSEGEISSQQLGEFVRPFVKYLGTQQDVKLVSHCRKQVLYHLLYQSALGREYMEKYNAWKAMGFPTASIHELELEEVPMGEREEDEVNEEMQTDEKHLDPRAGNVDVLMPELPLDGKHVIEELEKLLYKNEECSTKRRKLLRKLLELFQRYEKGEFPLGVKRMPRFKAKSEKPLIRDKIDQLENLESEMFGVGRKLKQLNKRKRRKLLKSLALDNVDESNFEQTIAKALPKQYLKERKRKAQALMNGWVEEEIDETELLPEKKAKNKKKANKEALESKLNSEEQQNGIKTSEEVNTEPPRKIKKKTEKESTPDLQNGTAASEQGAAQPLKKVKQHNSAKLSEKVQQSQEEGQAKKKQKHSELRGKAAKVPKALSASPETETASEDSTTKSQKSEWDTPLSEGEIEYFIPSRKVQIKKANSKLVLNPLAARAASVGATPESVLKTNAASSSTPATPASVKRVKIALKHNTVQNPSEYIRQIKSSPDVPYDAAKKPGKGLLKPNSMPSPINPFYKKKIGLRLMNDTM